MRVCTFLIRINFKKSEFHAVHKVLKVERHWVRKLVCWFYQKKTKADRNAGGRTMEKVVGIDLGTTNSAIAAVDSFTGKGECIQNKDGSNLTASAVCFQNREELMIGNTAYECKIIYPETTATLVKRLIGVEKTAITVDGRAYSPQQISALVLKSMKEDAETELGQTIHKAVITVPAYFDRNRRQATIEAGMEAGFEVLDLLDEPVAALYNADTIRSYAGKTVLIYDLGGGTLDIVCAKITETSIDEIVISGDNHLGGSDWDNTFISYIKSTNLKGVSLDASAEQELANKAEMAKKELSRKNETSFTVMTSSGREEIRVTREEFEHCTATLLNRAMNVLKETKETLEEKGVFKLDQIILCGGSTRMPQIEQGIAAVYPGVDIFAKDRDQAVAKGAAIYAEALMKEKQPSVSRSEKFKPAKKLNRVTSRSYGIAAFTGEDEKKVCNMLFQNEGLPAEKKDVFYTKYDKQKQVGLEVFESIDDQRYKDIGDASLLGKCYLNINGDLPKHSPIIVNIRMEENGVLYIHGYEESGKTEVTAHMQTQALLSSEDIIAEKKQVDDIYVNIV